MTKRKISRNGRASLSSIKLKRSNSLKSRLKARSIKMQL